jgi:hypothetical protein
MYSRTRESYSVFPRWSQPLWTTLTGKPAEGEKPLWILNGWEYLIISLAVFSAGTLGSVWVVSRGFTPKLVAIPLYLTLAVLGARLLILTVAHQCAHLRFCYSKQLNQLVHDILTSIICSQNYDSYRYDHFHVHHGLRTFGTFEDPVLVFIRKLGFTEKLNKKQLWGRLVATCISPRFHVQYLANRIRQNFFGGRLFRRIFAFGWWSMVIVLLAMHPRWVLPVTIGYLLPVTLLYNVSAFFELICEHDWTRPLIGTGDRQRITELSWGRFCGEATPDGHDVGDWARWILRTVFYHLPCRVLVLTGDAPQHDFHHMAPNNRRWTVSAYERRDAVEAGKMEDREVWGLFEAIDMVFENISTVKDHRFAVTYLDVAPSAIGG